MDSLVRHLVGTGIAPSFVIGDDVAGWNWETDVVDRAQRSFFVIPRSGEDPPFVLVYDDLDFFGGNAWESRFFWQVEEEAVLSVVDRDRARSVMSETAADMSFLRPAPNAPLTVDIIDPPSGNWPPHPRLTTTFAASLNPNVVALLEPYLSEEGPSLLATPIAQSDPKTFAYSIAGPSDFYVVVLRQADATGVVTLSVDGDTLRTDARHTVLHFRAGDHSWSGIIAGLMAGGTRVWYDGQYVMGIYNGSRAGDLTFDAGEVSVAFDSGGSASPEYYVGPVLPASAVVDGVEQATDMIDLPHPLRSSFPTRVCRSPNNGTVPAQWRYTVEAYLRTAEGNPVAGWPADKIRMDIRNCPNPRYDLLPEGPSGPDGKLVWIDGLDSGGSYQVAGGSVVLVDLDYGADGMGHLHAYDSVTSPDEDGDSDVDEDDFVIWNAAFEHGEPLYIGDLDRDDAITWDDYSWLQAHGLQGEHHPRLRDLDLKMLNPAPLGITLQCHIPEAGPTKLDVFDVQGRRVRTLLDGPMPRGVHSLPWDGRDDGGRQMASGVYLIRLQHDGATRILRFVLLH
ncbi:MAG: FlgD immunoglobulin-like domain containing protein [Candidatus Eisenbacteria bacterium]|nr:FlgD immunoglobulin-like domain containing protein [Candidatus Eisenbacteria bacterium]